MVEEHAIHSTAFRTAGKTPMVGIRVSACLRGAEEADNIQSGFVPDHSDDQRRESRGFVIRVNPNLHFVNGLVIESIMFVIGQNY